MGAVVCCSVDKSGYSFGSGGASGNAGTSSASGGNAGRGGAGGNAGRGGSDVTAGRGGGEVGGMSTGSGGANTSTGGGGVDVPPGSVEDGKPCSANADCASTYCVDDVCCGTKCNGACEACAEAYTGEDNGTCAPAKDGVDPHDDCEASAPETCGDDGQCNGAGECRKHGSNQPCEAAACTGETFAPARSCDGAGSCAPSKPVDCGAFPCTPTGCAKPCTDDTECGTGNYCSAGTCKTQKPNGETCSEVNECASGICVDGVCCETACTGACMACSEVATGQRSGRCQPVQAGLDPDNECTTEQPATCGRDGTCDGSGACRKYGTTTTCAEASCSGSTFTPERKCSAGTCAAATAMNCGASQCSTAGCRTSCTMDTPDCQATAYCAAGTCTAKKGNGSACSAGNECTSSACIDGVCCETACTAKCYACSMAKTGQANGKCAAVATGSDPDNECSALAASTCGTDGMCNGAGACRLHSSGVQCGAALCNSAGDYLSSRTCDGVGTCSAATTDVCAPSVCDAATGCKRTCTSDAQCVGNYYCSGTTCAAKKTTGTACTAANQCATGNCVDGFCCDGTCTGKCSACSMAKTGQANGKCAAVPGGQDPDNECATDASKPCDLDGTCNGAGACRIASNTTTCGTAMCGSTNTLTPAGMCNGAGTCVAGSAGPCPGGFVCASTSACRTSCTAASHCASGNYCNGSTCAPKILDGQPCTSAAQCLSGACTSFYRDQDADMQGTTTDTKKLCGTGVPTGYVTNSDDCCDTNSLVKKPRNQPGDPPVAFETSPASTCAKKWDFDCNGVEEKQWPTLADCSVKDGNGNCPLTVFGYWTTVLPCGPNTTGELFGGACTTDCCEGSSCFNAPSFNKAQGCR